MLIQYFFVFFFEFQSALASVTCDPNNKIRLGPTGENQLSCINHGGCFDSTFGCYFSRENIPGFRMMKGECTSCSTKEIFNNLERMECARECLKTTDCNCFIYDSSIKECLIKNVVCHGTSSKDGSKITYSRFASTKVTCSSGDCWLNDILAKYASIEDCYTSCKNDPNCKSIVQVMNGNHLETCFIKNSICDFTEQNKRLLYTTACLPGPIFPDWLTKHHLNRAEIVDDSNSTCKSVGLADNFNLKIPWPTVGDAIPDFKISIIGKNMQKCIDFLNPLPENGVIAFVVYEFHPTYQFMGNFKACKLISGNDNIQCIYECSCGIDYCEAVHIRAFSSDEANMSICHYQILK